MKNPTNLSPPENEQTQAETVNEPENGNDGNYTLERIKTILKGLNKMGMDWIKRTIHQSTIWQRIKSILIITFIFSAILSLSTPKSSDGKIKLDQVITYKTVEIQKQDINIKQVKDKEIRKKYKDYAKTDKITVEPSSIFTEFKERGWFNALVVWPLSQMINILADLTNPTFALLILTGAIQFIILIVNTIGVKKQLLLNKVKKEVKEIKNKIKESDDKAEIKKYRKEIRCLYRKNRVHPYLQIVFNYINLPILFGIYYAVQRSYALITGTFLGVNLSISPKEGFQTGNHVITVIFIVMVACYCFQTVFNDILKRIYNASHEDKREVKTIVNYITAFFWVYIVVRLYYKFPASMSIYWTVTVLFMCIQALVNEHYIIKSKEKNAISKEGTETEKAPN